jgi:competence protein ComEA
MIRTLLSLAVCAPLLVAQPWAQTPDPKPAGPASAKPGALVNLNTASLTELQSLPGVGARTAERIVEYRQKNGPFKKIEELMNVQGIGEKSFLKLKPQITVAAKADAAATQQD